MRNILGFLAILALLLSALTSANIQSGASRTAFTPEDALTIKVNGVDYTLGRSTPAVFAANGWEMFQLPLAGGAKLFLRRHRRSSARFAHDVHQSDVGGRRNGDLSRRPRSLFGV